MDFWFLRCARVLWRIFLFLVLVEAFKCLPMVTSSRGILASSPGWPRSRKQAHESGSRQVRREEMLVFETGGAGQRLGRQITAANGAFHRCRPACCCPVTCKEYARP